MPWLQNKHLNHYNYSNYLPALTVASHYILPVYSWLVEIGASLNVSFPVPLWEIEGKGAESIPADKLEEWFHYRDDHPVGHLTPLLAALRVGDFVQVKFLLTKGADLNFPGKDTLTPLMCAVRRVSFSSTFLQFKKKSIDQLMTSWTYL